MKVPPTAFPTIWEFNQDAIYVLPQLRGDSLSYLRAPRLDAGVFVAPMMRHVLTLPPNPAPVLGTQIGAQIQAQDQLFRMSRPAVPAENPSTKAPPPAGPPPMRRSVTRDTSQRRTPGADCRSFIAEKAFRGHPLHS